MAQGSEFRVNTHTTDEQQSPTIAMDDDGDFVVAWTSTGQDGYGGGIFAQRYNASATAQGGEFQVNTYTADYQLFASAAMDADGDFVIAWISSSQDGDDDGIYAQRFNSSGTAQGSEFRVNTHTTGQQTSPAVAMDASGDFVISWSGVGQDTSYGGTYAQRYNSAGTAQGSEFQVNTYTTNSQGTPSISMNSDGDFVIAWLGEGTGDTLGVFAQRYNSSGTAQGGEFRVNLHTTGQQFGPSVDQDGDELGVYAHRFL